MQFSQSAVAALLLAAATTVSARCAPRPSASSSYSSAATILPSTVETLSAVATPTPTPSSSSAAVVPTTLATTSSSAAAAATPTTSGLTTDEQNALAAHNAARAEVGVSDLTWDESLVSAAQAWADTLGARGPGQLEHGSTGENLYWQSGTSDDALTAASDAWIAEKADYNGEAIPASGDASWMHYCEWEINLKIPGPCILGMCVLTKTPKKQPK